EQVEVIKGADSVYSGRGSGGGSINLGSKAPRLQTFTHVGASVGTDSYLRGTIDQNWALSDTSALRLNLMGAQGDVPGRDSVDYDKWGLALSYAIGLGQATTLTASYYHLESNQMPDYGIPLFTKIGTRTTASGVLDVPYSSFYGLSDRDFLTNTVDSFTVNVEHRFSETLRLRNVTRYSETLNDYIVTNPGDGGAAQFVGGEWWMKRGTKTRWNPADTLANVTDLSGSFSTGGLSHTFNLGLELAREENRNAAYTTFTTAGAACPVGFVLPVNTANSLGAGDCTRVYAPNSGDSWTGVINRGPTSESTTETVGVYAFDSVNLTDNLILNLGLRWDRYSVSGINRSATATAGVYGAVTEAVAPEAEWDFTNYQIGLVYKPTANTSVYASYSTASTPPTIASGDQNTAPSVAQTLLDPEESTNYEIGAKASLFRDQLQLSAAIFRLDRENAVTQTTPTPVQDGEVRVQGLELGVSGNITPEWQVFGGYTYMDSELVKGALTSGGLPNPLNGQQLANTPEHSLSVFTTYRVSSKLSLGGGVYYVSDSLGGNQGGAGGGTNRIYAPEYTRVDLFAAYDIDDMASLQLNIQNAGDEEYIIRTNGVHHADVAPARQAILTLNLRY
ncbi:MAG: TonB-dependent receptor, partial [Brevundimonas sp.]